MTLQLKMYRVWVQAKYKRLANTADTTSSVTVVTDSETVATDSRT